MKSHYRHVLNKLSVAETPPHVERIDFFNYIRRYEGSNLTLSAKVSSNIPLLAGYPKWAVDFNLPLPSTAMVDNCTIDGTIYSNLTLYELSFENDTGNYTFTAENKCGSSFVYVYIDVRKGTLLYHHIISFCYQWDNCLHYCTQ